MVNDTAVTHVLIVEDDADLCSAFAEYLELNDCMVTTVSSGMGFYQALAKDLSSFHVAIIDLGLPDQRGNVLIDYARHNSQMSIITISANGGLDARIEAYHSGSDLFLSKPIDSRELLAAIVAMNNRFLERKYTDSVGNEIIETKPWYLDVARRQLCTPDGDIVQLNTQETVVCDIFHASGADIVGRKKLLEVIYERDDESSQRALDNMIRRLRTKITEISPPSSPILTAYSLGYSFSEPLKIV